MKKRLIIICLLIIIIICLIPSGNNELRMRVIANSDTPSDQLVKMTVVNSLNAYLSTLDKDDIVNEIKSNICEIDNVVGEHLHNTSYTLSITNVRFPAKEINGEIIPGGKYPTLLVVIGEGKGKNWWSLLYPNYHGFYFEDLQTADVECKFFLWEEIKKLLFKDE